MKSRTVFILLVLGLFAYCALQTARDSILTSQPQNLESARP